MLAKLRGSAASSALALLLLFAVVVSATSSNVAATSAPPTPSGPPLCRSLQPCANSNQLCQLAIDNPNYGECVGEPCQTTANCPFNLVCSVISRRCQACADDQFLYSSKPCQGTCADPNPTSCPGEGSPGCACPSTLPILLPNGKCGTFDQCSITPASVCRATLPRVQCRRNPRCKWFRSRNQCGPKPQGRV